MERAAHHPSGALAWPHGSGRSNGTAAEAQLGAGVPMAEAIAGARAEVGVYPGCTVAVLRASA